MLDLVCYSKFDYQNLNIKFSLIFDIRHSVKYFTDRSKAVLLLWIFYVFLSCVCYAFVCVCLYVPCGHLLGLGSRLWCLTVSLSLSNWYLVCQVWYLNVSIPDLCSLTYFYSKTECRIQFDICYLNLNICFSLIFDIRHSKV